MSYIQHLSGRADLITDPKEIRSGFVALALERNRQATPFVEKARALKVLSMKARTPRDLLKIDGIQSALLTASGYSNKAIRHTDEISKREALQGLIDTFLEPAGSDFIEELVYRFLLTSGDSLGGSMRNIAGKLAERKLTRSIISALSITQTDFQWLDNISKTWIAANNDEADIELNLKALSWENNSGNRTLIYNRTIPLVKKI